MAFKQKSPFLSGVFHISALRRALCGSCGKFADKNVQ